jgi:signal transduction histidine kinase
VSFVRRQQVTVADFLADPAHACLHEGGRKENIRAVFSTPLPGAEGKCLGVMTVYFDAPYRPGLSTCSSGDIPADGRFGLTLPLPLRLRLLLPLQLQWGRRRWRHVTSAGQVREWISLSQDITELRQVEERLALANTGKDEFLAILGHELRSPLSATKMDGDVLGLGLALVKRLAQLHGAAVTAESAGRDLGSTFQMVLPLHS